MSTSDADPRPPDSTPTVTVRGEAVLRAEPDEAMLWITLSALESDPGQALSDVSRRSKALGALLDELGVVKSDRSTTGVTVYEDFDHTPSGRQSLGHRATASIAARFTDPEPIGRLIAQATTDLQARINGPRWQIAAHNPIHLDAAREQPPTPNKRHKPSPKGSERNSDASSTLSNPAANSPGIGCAEPA